jgi:predicted TIM-barrel fold metal-dependent hydrolase
MAELKQSRRGFVRGCVAGAAAAAVAVGTLPRRVYAAEKSFPPGKYVDMHTHIGQTFNHTRELTVKALLEWMDQHEIAQAVVLPLVSPEASTYLLTTDVVLEQTAPHRDRLIPFCCLDPRTTHSGKRHGLKDILQRWMDRGAKGFGEHKPGLPVDDPRSQEIYAVCGDLKLPLLFHVDEQRNTDAPGLPGLRKVLETHPHTTFIGHGPGWWASISGDVTAAQLGGYPKTKIAPGGAMEALMDVFPNIFSELSAGSGAGAMSRDPEFAKSFIVRRADRLMFGSDYLSPGQQVPQFGVLDPLELPAEVQAKVFRDNARRLLGLTG